MAASGIKFEVEERYDRSDSTGLVSIFCGRNDRELSLRSLEKENDMCTSFEKL